MAAAENHAFRFVLDMSGPGRAESIALDGGSHSVLIVIERDRHDYPTSVAVFHADTAQDLVAACQSAINRAQNGNAW